MSIKVGDKLPETRFFILTSDGPTPRTTLELFAGKRAVLVGVPGAFTPTCHRNHLPGYVELQDEFKAAGVDEIFVTAINDPFVMNAWREASKAGDAITFLSDGNGEFARAVGLEFDGSERGLGLRSKRYAMLLEDGVVKILNVEETPREANISSATRMLETIRGA